MSQSSQAPIIMGHESKNHRDTLATLRISKR